MYATPNLSLGQMVGMYLASLSGMILGVIAFVFYDRHYFSKNIETNVIHSTIFAMGMSLLSIFSAYMSHRFEQATLLIQAIDLNNGGVTWLFSILRTVFFLASAPLVTYSISKLAKRY